MLKQLGKLPTKADKERYQESTNWKNGKFENQVHTSMDMSITDIPGLIHSRIKGRKELRPKKQIPIIPFKKAEFEHPSEPTFAWYGHAVLFMRLTGLNILIDPMLGEDASPVGPIRTKRFSDNTLKIIEQLPLIDVLLLSHDHYDHLDLKSIDQLKDRCTHIITTLGVARHLKYWGVDPNKITELDWWDEFQVEELKITSTPSRHFSGRGLTDRSLSLWGGFMFETPNHTIYWSGDGGYGPHFKEIGEKFGDIDLAFIECGQYNKLWQDIHMFPEESAQVIADVGAKRAVPVHWAGFTLALHPWTEPVKRFLTAAQKQSAEIITPEIGAVFTLGTPQKSPNNWWEEYE